MTLTRMVNGEVVALTADEETQLQAEWAAADAATAANAWVQERTTAYGALDQQLDYIYHNGINAWAQMIYTIKQQYPKPNTAPSAPNSTL